MKTNMVTYRTQKEADTLIAGDVIAIHSDFLTLHPFAIELYMRSQAGNKTDEVLVSQTMLLYIAHSSSPHNVLHLH